MPAGRPPSPPPKLPPALVRRYVAGELGRDALAREAGVSDKAAERALRALGVYRTKGQGMAAHFAAKHGRRRALAVRLRAQGLTLAAIGARLGVGAERVRQIVEQYG